MSDTILSMADPIDVFVGVKLRERRRALGLSQEAVGVQLGVTFQQVQKYERGTNRISASMLVRAAKALGVTPGWFFEGLPDVGSEAAGGDSLGQWLVSAEGQAWCRIGANLSAEARGSLMRVAEVILSAEAPALGRAA